MKQRHVVTAIRILVLSLCLLTWACQGVNVAPPQPTMPPPRPVTKPPPTRDPGSPLLQQHHWDALLQMDAETEGYGGYTYVLFSRRLDLRAELDPEILQRYQSLLTAIVSSTLDAADVGEISAADKRLTNLFYIPTTLRNSLPSLDNYNSALAMRYLDEFSKLSRSDSPQVANRLQTRPGPFLISTLKPLGKIDSEKNTLLYADLSTTNPAAMTEIVAAYKQRLSEDRSHETEQFSTLRLKLLNLILNADDNITLVKAALAQWIPQ